MTTAMFHVKHHASASKRGSSRGLDAARPALISAMAGLLGLATAACSSPEEVAEKTGVAKATATAGTATAAASSAGGEGSNLEDNAEQDGGTREFQYSWPAAVSAIPVLRDRFTQERDTVLSEQKAEWQSALAELAGEDCTACKSMSLQKSWAVVTDLPRFLSLSAEIYFYTGGAHGNSGYDALVWDREAKAALTPEAMFRSEAALQDALGDAWCKALRAEKQKRMGEDFSDDGFFPCPPIADLTVLLGSSNKQTFSRIGLIAAPYVAGSYAEGPYEVTLPVTPAVLAAVKPEYKAAFASPK
ncbi:MAG: hypothetical protein C0471_06130 [Erythrobacter sp.]|nr:hypothetical protein [Erythrobacter sp.]